MRTLSKIEKQEIKSKYNWSLSYLLIDIITKFGDNTHSLEDDIGDAITAYHNALRANWGEK